MLVMALHVIEVAIVASTVTFIHTVKPAYSAIDLMMIIAVGMIAGAIYIESIKRIVGHIAKRASGT